MRVEAREVILDLCRRIALGIDRDEQCADLVGLGAELAEHLRHLEQRRRAHVGAMGVAEEHQERPAAQVGVGNGAAVLVGEPERSADRRTRVRQRRRIAAGDDDDDQEDAREPGEERRHHQKHAQGSCTHRRTSNSIGRRDARLRNRPRGPRRSSRRTPRCHKTPTARLRPPPARPPRPQRPTPARGGDGREELRWNEE